MVSHQVFRVCSFLSKVRRAEIGMLVSCTVQCIYLPANTCVHPSMPSLSLALLSPSCMYMDRSLCMWYSIIHSCIPASSLYVLSRHPSPCRCLPFLVYSDGSLCLDILQDKWTPIHTVSTILTSIQVQQRGGKEGVP